jgi:two-component system cell cycle sensor histidine kinase/response regulator CckA
LAENENVRTPAIDVAAELLEALPDPVIGCDVDGTVVYWSRAAEEVYGYNAEEALGRRAATLLHTRFPVPLLEIIEELGDLGRWRGRLEHRCKGGRTVSVDSRWVARRDAHGAHVGSFAVDRELDGEPTAPPPARAEEPGLIPRAAAHELNNALAIIVNYSAFVTGELDAPSGASSEAMRADLSQVQAAAEQAVQIARRLQGAA